ADANFHDRRRVRRGKADNGRRLVRRPAGVVAQRQDDRVCLRPRDAATPETVALSHLGCSPEGRPSPKAHPKPRGGGWPYVLSGQAAWRVHWARTRGGGLL